jgi:hypothetical protein
MKTKIAILFTLATLSCSADQFVPVALNFDITALAQNPTNTDNGITTTVDSPLKTIITSTNVLNGLAQAEFNEGYYSTNKFPKGSKLIFMNDVNDLSQSYFIVENSKGQFLADVSDIIQYEATEDFIIVSGKFSDANGLRTNWEETYVGTLFYDDTEAGGVTQLQLKGLVQATANDGKLSTSNTYTETITAKTLAAAGGGTVNGDTVLLYGSISAKGSGTLTLQ